MDSKLLLKDLNREQQAAVKTTEGPLLILAGAGSGKTRVLTYRIAYLMAAGVSGRSILAVTFTNKAANEMKGRVLKLLAQGRSLGGGEPFMGTFHSLAVRVLRQEIGKLGFGENFLIYDEQDQLAAVKKAMARVNIATSEINPRALRAVISQAKNEMVSPREFLDRAAASAFNEEAARVYTVYQKILEEMNALDFDDLLLFLIKLFKKEPLVLKKYQDRFRYLLVDEYQDTNKVQYSLIKMLAAKNRNLCVVGDDWQSIYGFRGADIRNILDFERDYPEAKIIKLEQNYRSTQNILDAAHLVMEKSEERKEKKLWTKNQSGEKVTLYLARDAFDEAEYVAKKVLAKASERLEALPEAAVLYRTNAQSRVLEEVFLRYGIPYQIVGGLKFYERKEIKDMLAYLRLVYNESDDLSFARVVNEPTRRVGRRSLTLLEKAAGKEGLSLLSYLKKDQELAWLRGPARRGLEEFREVMRESAAKLGKLNLTELIDFLLKKSNLFFALKNSGEEGENRLENILELKSVAGRFTTSEKETWKDLGAFLEEVSLLGDIDAADEKSKLSRNEKSYRRIVMMTVHSAKGLEFDNIFLVGLEETLFPHSRSLFEPKEIEEERRLCYVGMTRAKRELYLLRALEREIFGNFRQNPPSRFLEDIPEEKMNLEGLAVTPARVKNDGEVQYIDFEV